jgi:ABC-type phosphate transport system auxiliary subunit
MSDSGPNDVSRAPKRERVGTVACQERSRLQEQLQAIEKELDDLVAEQFAAFHANDQTRFWRLNKKLEPMRERQERAQIALRKHIRTHRCQPLDTPAV